MQIQLQDYLEHKVIILGGRWDLYNVDELRGAIFSYIDSGSSSIVIDMADVTAIDSSIIGALYVGQRKITALSGRFYLANISNHVQEVINLTQLFFETIDLDMNH